LPHLVIEDEETETETAPKDLDAYAEPLMMKNSLKSDDMLRQAAMLGVELLGEREKLKGKN
jgi:hypothetical protein